MIMICKFKGKPDKTFPDLVTGKIYTLTVVSQSRGFFGSLVGNTCPLITKPIYCPYRNWDTFYENWEQL